MHYKNGREAHEGDQVVGKSYNNTTVVGRIFDLQPGSDTCNAQIERPVGVGYNITVGQFYHADDAFDAVNAPFVVPPKQPVEAKEVACYDCRTPDVVCEATAAAE